MFMKPLRIHLIVASLLAGLAVSCPAIATGGHTGVVSVEGHMITYRDYGAGDRVLVMISGLGDGMDSFAKVAPALAAGYRVIIYDRAGYGGSDRVRGTHDAIRAEGELKGLLLKLGIEKPVVLLGHSLGGVYAQYIAAKNPSLVSGLILDETRPTGFTAACKAVLKVGCEMPGLLKMALPGAGHAEADDAVMSEVEAEKAGGVNVPTLILVRHITAKDSKSFDGLWFAQQQKMRTIYSHSELKSAPKGGHYIHQDARDWFVSEVTTFMTKIESVTDSVEVKS